MYITTHFSGPVQRAMVYVNGLKCRIHLFQVVPEAIGCTLIFKITSREDMKMARSELGLTPDQEDAAQT